VFFWLSSVTSITALVLADAPDSCLNFTLSKFGSRAVLP